MNKTEAKLRRKHGGFMIGDLVMVDEFYNRRKDLEKAEYVRVPYPRYKPEPQAGWIVGFTSLRPGKLIWLESEGGHAYDPTGSVAAVQVKFWPHLKPVPVPYDGFRAWREGDPEPYPPNGSPAEIEEQRKMYREEVDAYPRDKKGRFK